MNKLGKIIQANALEGFLLFVIEKLLNFGIIVGLMYVSLLKS